jgi:hypothetical protein
MVAEIINLCVCACYGHRCRDNIMQIGLTSINDPNILELLLISSQTKNNKASLLSSFIHKFKRLSYSLFENWKNINICLKSLNKDEPQVLEIVLRTYDVGCYCYPLYHSTVRNSR